MIGPRHWRVLPQLDSRPGVALDRRGQLAHGHTQTMPCPGCAPVVTLAPVTPVRSAKGGAR